MTATTKIKIPTITLGDIWYTRNVVTPTFFKVTSVTDKTVEFTPIKMTAKNQRKTKDWFEFEYVPTDEINTKYDSFRKRISSMKRKEPTGFYFEHDSDIIKKYDPMKPIKEGNFPR